MQLRPSPQDECSCKAESFYFSRFSHAKTVTVKVGSSSSFVGVSSLNSLVFETCACVSQLFFFFLSFCTGNLFLLSAHNDTRMTQMQIDEQMGSQRKQELLNANIKWWQNVK